MTQVIYADILFVVNVYITYALIALTDPLARTTSSRGRKVLGAVLGGIYSFIIFIPSVPDWIIAVSRILFAAVLVFAVYGKQTRKGFLIVFGSFFLVNFIFAGLMFAVWYFIAPSSMLYYGSVVYFDIDTLTLVILTIVCYAIISVIYMLIRSRSPSDTLFELSVYLGGKSVTCKAFFDTGNSVLEPFTSLPVIIMNEDICGDLLNANEEIDSEKAVGLSLRYIPCSGFAGDGTLKAFRPERVHIKGIKTEIDTDKVFIALTKQKIKSGEYGALLNSAMINQQQEVLK